MTAKRIESYVGEVSEFNGNGSALVKFSGETYKFKIAGRDEVYELVCLPLRSDSGNAREKGSRVTISRASLMKYLSGKFEVLRKKGCVREVAIELTREDMMTEADFEELLGPSDDKN